jgi:4-diphosphocytidyl-2-C-methyl-D-erythritol kinase
MRRYRLMAPAKINLLLEILGHRPDGFHELVMVMQTIDLVDEIELTPLGGDRIRLHCDHPQVPQDETNLAYRAAQLMQSHFPGRGGVDITIQKNIPIGAGLAGGSANAAGVLVGLDLIWELGLTQGELHTLGAQLGSDVPFSITGGTALALGRGEQLTPLTDLDHLFAVLAKYRSLSISTPWAYQTYQQHFGDSYAQTPEAQEDRRRTGPSVPLLGAIAHRDLKAIGQSLYNDLEKAVFPEHPAVEQLPKILSQEDSLGTLMSGSGPTVFTLTDSRQTAEAIAQRVRATLPDPDLELWVTKFVPHGVRLA